MIKSLLACLVVASVVVAVMCRNFIGIAATPGDHLVRAIVVLYFGCFVFLSLWAGVHWAQALWMGGMASFHDTLSLYGMGMTAAVVSFFIIPYGLLCQYAMNSVGWSRAA